MTIHALLVMAGEVAAGDTIGAQGIATAAQSLLDSSDLCGDDRRRIYKIRKKWTARAAGNDARWNTHGSKPGRPKTFIVKSRRVYRDEADHDPILRAIVDKFGDLDRDTGPMRHDRPPEDE